MKNPSITFAPEGSFRNYREEGIYFPEVAPPASIMVVGAGVFGLWLCHHLMQQGFSVSLVDAYGPGHLRGSSSDESRLIRAIYGSNYAYFDLCRRSWTQWDEFQDQIQQPLLFPKGTLWFLHDQQAPFIQNALPFFDERSLDYSFLDKESAQQHYPFINIEDLDALFFDPHSGYLLARDACRSLFRYLVNKGLSYHQSKVEVNGPGKLNFHPQLPGKWNADRIIFCHGAWAQKNFPELFQDSSFTPTRQEVFYFGPPSGKALNWEADVPCWVEWDENWYFYGIPDSGKRGFKVAYDLRGERMDPDASDRLPSKAILSEVRHFLSKRFPALAKAPLLESRVCQYENAPGGNFYLAQHPENSKIILCGGGSGHGFKQGPAWGELVCEIIQGKSPRSSLFKSPWM